MNNILNTTKFVVDNSQFVHINHDRVVEFSRTFDHHTTEHWLNDAPFDLSQLTNEEKLHFVFLFNALSFSYWGEPKWTVEYNGKTHDGAYGMILALGRAIEENVPILDFHYCSQMSKEDAARILRGTIEIPLLEERWNILREVGSVIVKRYQGSVKDLIYEANGDAQKLVALIVEHLPSFSDTSLYKGEKIYFYKRAQLLVADIYQLFGGKGFGNLTHVDQLTACADYKLPQILRKLGILEYEVSLAEKIDGKIEILHNSPEEIEIKANTIWAVEYIKEELKKRNPNIMSFEVNDRLWLATQEKFAGDKPYHRTRTTAY